MDTVIRSVNYIKTCPLKSRLFAEMCEEIGAQYQSLLFYSNSHSLSRGNAVACVYNLRVAAALFLEEENLLHAVHFISKLARLSDNFEKFNTLDPSMQGNDTNIIIVTDKLKTFIGKLRLWVRKLEGKLWKQVTVGGREKERERECVRACVCVCTYKSVSKLLPNTSLSITISTVLYPNEYEPP
jgi:hypothetical protein